MPANATLRFNLAVLAALTLVNAPACVGPSDAMAEVSVSRTLPISTTSTDSTASTLEDWYVYATFGAFPHAAASLVEVAVRFFDLNYGGSFFMDLRECEVLENSATVTYEDGAFVFDFSAAAGGFRRSQNLLRCSWYSHDPASAAEIDWFTAQVNDAKDELGEPVELEFCATAFEVNPDSVSDELDVCGDVNGDGDVDVVDALTTLRSPIGDVSPSCTRCDVNRSGDVTASDALAILQAAVGLNPALLCPASCPYG